MEHKEKLKELNRTWAKEHPDRMRAFTIKSYWKHIKIDVLTYYGANSRYPACIHCGEMRLDCLSIDHIAGRGREHRRRVGSHMYQWLKANNYPRGYQTLCMNCQWIKRVKNQELRPKKAEKL